MTDEISWEEYRLVLFALRAEKLPVAGFPQCGVEVKKNRKRNNI